MTTRLLTLDELHPSLPWEQDILQQHFPDKITGVI